MERVKSVETLKRAIDDFEHLQLFLIAQWQVSANPFAHDNFSGEKRLGAVSQPDLPDIERRQLPDFFFGGGGTSRRQFSC